MQQIHRRKPMPKCDFNNFTEIALQHGCSPVHLLHIFRTPFPRNTCGWLLLIVHDDLDSYPLFLPFQLKLSHHFLVPKFVFFFSFISSSFSLNFSWMNLINLLTCVLSCVVYLFLQILQTVLQNTGRTWRLYSFFKNIHITFA